MVFCSAWFMEYSVAMGLSGLCVCACPTATVQDVRTQLCSPLILFGFAQAHSCYSLSNLFILAGVQPCSFLTCIIHGTCYYAHRSRHPARNQCAVIAKSPIFDFVTLSASSNYFEQSVIFNFSTFLLNLAPHSPFKSFKKPLFHPSEVRLFATRPSLQGNEVLLSLARRPSLKCNKAFLASQKHPVCGPSQCAENCSQPQLADY